MNEFNELSINGKLLQTLVTVHEEGSITQAAIRLGVTQSAVSHMLDRLRTITGDPLFIKSGRTIAATANAAELVGKARIILDHMRQFTSQNDFNPAALTQELTIAAGDLQRDLLLPRLFERLRTDAPHLRLRVIPSNIPTLDMLRTDHCLMAISPRPPDGSDILHRRLFTSHYAVFYDQSSCLPPSRLEDYQNAEHISVTYESNRHLDIDTYLARKGIERHIVVSVTNFGGIPPFLNGSQCLATLPVHLHLSQLSQFSYVAPPFKCPELPVYAIWHQRYQHDPLMKWLLTALYSISDEIVKMTTFPSLAST